MKSIKKNYIYNLCYQCLLLITPLITTPYLARTLGADKIGIVSYTESVVSYFVLFATLGITTYGQREISYVQNDIQKRSEVFWNTKILQIIISSFVLIIYILFLNFHSNDIIYMIFSLNIVSVLLDVTWFFQGMEEFGKIVFRNMFFKLANIIYIFILVKSPKDVVTYVLGITGFSLISNLSLWIYIPKYIKKISLKILNPFKNLKAVISLFVPTIAIQVYTVLDKTMIGIITKNEFENGYYDQALKISKMILTLVTALGTVMIPRIGYYFEQKDNTEIKRLMYKGYRFVWFLGVPLCLGLVMVSDNIVPWFLGAGYEKVADLLKILAFLIIAIGINNVTGMQYLIPTKREGIFTITVIIGATTNFLMNICLIERYGALGAAIASVGAEFIIAIIQIIIVRKELEPREILKEGVNYFVAGVAMTIVLYFVKRRMVSSMIDSIILVIVGAAVYIVVLICRRDEFLIANMKDFRHRVKEIVKGK